jgi:DnaJ-domain-containing protein 1
VDYSFPVELESCERAQEACTAASAAEWNAAHPSLFAQVEQLLGGDAEPDTAFFIDSWTLGVAAASENFLRRRQEQKASPGDREFSGSAFSSICSFPPFITVEEPLLDAERSNRNADLSPQQAEQPSRNAELPSGSVDLPSSDAELPAPAAWPLTLEAARVLLGVTAASSRDAIKAAYRQMASVYHPDHLARRGDRERRLATERMAAINEAYRLLCAANLA